MKIQVNSAPTIPQVFVCVSMGAVFLYPSSIVSCFIFFVVWMEGNTKAGVMTDCWAVKKISLHLRQIIIMCVVCYGRIDAVNFRWIVFFNHEDRSSIKQIHSYFFLPGCV